MPLARADVRDVCFAHWPVEPASLAAVLPDALAPATRDGTAWVSVLAQRTRAGLGGLPGRYEFPQVACRTYVVPDGDSAPGLGDPAVGVFFLRVAAPSRLATLGGRIAFGIPYVRAPVDLRRTAESIRVRTESDDGARYVASLAPEGDPTPADPDSLVA